jgi:hypothetical protein
VASVFYRHDYSLRDRLLALPHRFSKDCIVPAAMEKEGPLEKFWTRRDKGDRVDGRVDGVEIERSPRRRTPA